MPDRSIRSILICIWVGVVFFISISPAVRLATGYRGALGTAPPMVTLLRLLGLVVLVFLITGFVRRNTLAIWASIGVLAVWTLLPIVRIPFLLNDLRVYGASVVAGFVLIVLNILSMSAIFRARYRRPAT